MYFFFGIKLRIKFKDKIEICAGEESVGVIPCHFECEAPAKKPVATVRE